MKIKKDTANTGQGFQRYLPVLPREPYFPGHPLGAQRSTRNALDARAMTKLMTGVLDDLLPSLIKKKPITQREANIKTRGNKGNRKFRK